MSETNSNKMHLVIGGILLLIGVFVVVALIVVYSQAESDTTTVSITNVNPTVDSHYTNATSTYSGSDYWTTLTLTSGSITTIYINGVVSDANGEDDINDVDMTLYRSAATNACSADVNDCYIVSNCSLTANDSDSKYYSCTADIAYYADSTGAGGPYPAQTWEAKVVVNDKNSGTGNSTKTNMEVATLLSLNIPETGIAYGTLASNTSTVASNNQEMTITQYGNDEADVLVSGTDMSCSGLGYIPSGEQEWSLTDTDHSATNNTDLAPTAVDTDLNVGYRTDGAVSKILYWNINVPYGNVGTCTGTNTISATAH